MPPGLGPISIALGAWRLVLGRRSPPRPGGEGDPPNAVVRDDDGPVSFRVDPIGDVHGPETDRAEPATERSDLGCGRLATTRGVHRCGPPEEAFDVEEAPP